MNRDDQTRHEVVRLTVRADVPAPPPPPGFTTPFKSLDEWLFYLCDSENAEKLVADLQFGLTEYAGRYMVSVDGFNQYAEEPGVVVRRIEFQPEHNFFPLPDEYKKRSAQEAQKQVLSEFKAFLQTDKFEASFMAKAESIKLNFQNGEYYALK